MSKRLAQVDLQRAAGADGLLHGGVEDAVGVAAFGLDEIQRDVRAAQEVRQRLAAGGEQCHADAGADAEVVAVHLVELGEFGHHEAGERGAVPALLAAEADDGEFVAAQAHHAVILAQAGAQAVRHLAQQRVAHRVAARVVDLLEAVQVDQQDGGGHAVAPGCL